ncbi:hypothetical protein F0562_027908 [Nyssa sinensis]|uniref:CCHC-type domain-containing protein n=1 Tax=Nyssa sinensis TaxID=561372 RepID=A0A5J5B6A6_9ASTE|nr:hypothetical protein F0562_027908 [Nyssa sinensis]
MKMVIEDELQALLLLSSLPDSWETLVVTVSNSAPDGNLSMGQVSSSLFNEETRRKLVDTDNAQALISENRGRSKNRGYKGHGKSKRRSQFRGKSTEKGKCYHCGKEGHMRKNCYAWKREQKEENNNQKKNEEKNTTATFEADEVVVLSCGEEECLHAGDFGTVMMGNTSYSKIVGIGDVCIRTNVGCTMTLRDVRHVPNLRLNLIYGIALNREGYVNYFNNGIWKLTKGSLVVARGKACCALYKTNLKVYRDRLNSIEDVDIVVDLTHNTPPLEHAEDGGEVQEEPVRDETPLMTDDMLELDNEVEMPEEETVKQGKQPHQQEPVETQVRKFTREHRPSTKYSSSEFIMLTNEGEPESF